MATAAVWCNSGVWTIRKPLNSLSPCFLLADRLVLCLPLCTDRSLYVRAQSQQEMCIHALSRERSTIEKITLSMFCRWSDDSGKLLNIMCMLLLCIYLVLCFCCVSQEVDGNVEIVEMEGLSDGWSRYEIAVGDSVSFGVCSDLFAIKSDVQANIRYSLYLYDGFWLCVVRSYELNFCLNLWNATIVTSTAVK